MYSHFTLYSIITALSLLATHSKGKRLRLPILLRSPKIDCTIIMDECGINQSLDQFTLYQNSSFIIAGRCQYYQFTIKVNQTPLSVVKFGTIYFPNMKSSTACLHMEYNVQGEDKFRLIVNQKTRSKPVHIVYNSHVLPSNDWKSVNIDVRLCEDESQFLVEVLCEWCSRDSIFSVSCVAFYCQHRQKCKVTL